jgi:hypothetical protein
MVADSAIDDLYRLPLSEFTAARDRLARSEGDGGAEIKRLQKPNAAAWAVNQVYWRQRKTFDRLIRASERLRRTYGDRLAGKRAEVTMAEEVHRAAVKAAVEEARRALEDAGDALSPATMTAVTETFQMLPSPGPPGRLTRPLKPTGFEALAGLLGRGGSSAGRLADVVPIDSRRSARPLSQADHEKREAEARRRERAGLRKELTAARAAERKSETELARARQALERAVEERAELEAALERSGELIQRLRADVNQALTQSRDAAAERERLDRRLADVDAEDAERGVSGPDSRRMR